MKRIKVVAASLCVVLFGLGGVIFSSLPAIPTYSVQESSTVFVLDPGHGGEDGGAVSANGTEESGINLAIAQKMDLIFGLLGENSLLLREDDRSLHDEAAVTIREKKVSDLKNRAAAVNRQNSPVLISIHQNSYPDPRYWGLQTFYAPTEHSLALAECMQAAIRQQIQSENLRQTKQIPENVYLMHHVNCPAVLVECGFLTNPEEELRLQDAGYQTKLAAVLVNSITRWFGNG